MITYTDTPQEAFTRISKGLKIWGAHTLMAAEYIVEAKEREIWKLKYDSWKDFCIIECGFSDEWVNRLISASKLSKELRAPSQRKSPEIRETEANLVGSTEGAEASRKDVSLGVDLPADLTPKQADALKGLSTPEMVTVLEAAKAIDPTIPPKAIATARIQVVAATSPPPEPPKRFDEVGRVIPSHIILLWDRAALAAKEPLAILSKMRTALRKSQEESDLIYREMNFSSILPEVDNAYAEWKRVVPHAVCAYCQGVRSDKCTSCKGRGFVSKFYWDRCVADDLKALVLNKK